MTRLAIASLRLTNQDIKIYVCVDYQTHQNLQNQGDPLLKELDHCIVVDQIPSEDPLFINRYIKTQVLKWVDPPFLFLDSDILVRGSLQELFALNTDIAVVNNNHGKHIEEQLWQDDAVIFAKMSWPIPRHYYNGGVVLYQNSDAAKAFSDSWFRFWKDSYDLTGRFRDQPSLNHALDEFQGRVRTLDYRYNHQFRMGGGPTDQSIIWHFYDSGKSKNKTRYQKEVQSILKGKKLSCKRVQKMIDQAEPWDFHYHLRVKCIKIQNFVNHQFKRYFLRK